MSDEPVVDAPPAAYVFPFEVPADLTTVSDEDLRALHAQVREHAATFAGLSPAETTQATIEALTACRDLAAAVSTVVIGRRDAAASAADLFAELDADLPEPDGDGDAGDGGGDDGGEPEPAPADPTPADPAPAAVTAARRPAPPRVRDVARTSRGPALPAQAQRGAYASMNAAAPIAGFHSGQKLERFADAAKALSAQLERYPSMSAGRASGNGRKRFTGSTRPVTVYDAEDRNRTFELRDYVRQNVIELRREFPEELRVDENVGNGYAVAEFASSERRLPGGSLIKSVAESVRNGRSLTAAAGWCAPSDVIYDLLELETLDGMLDLPELQTTRGGWQIPIDGGPDFSSIWTALGSAGDTHLTEAEVIADTAKVCTEIPCPPFEDVRLGVDYYCLTGGLLQRRGYPEVVGRFSRGATIALAHKINYGVIASIVTASGAAIVIPQDPNGDDAASAVLAAIDLAITDAKYRNRMGFNATMEAVFPEWVLVPIRAGLARRRGVRAFDVTNAEILGWFAERNAVPRLVYDWQDAFSGLATGPGGATALTRLPATVDFLIYPAGTWVKAVQDVVALDTIYDSTMLATNQYTAVFVEDGWATLQMSPTSRLYRVNVDPGGVTGCCDTVGS